jgi:hypothetical protein
MPYSLLERPTWQFPQIYFQKVGVFFATTNDHKFTTFLPAKNHVFAPKNHQKTPIFRKTPLKNTSIKKYRTPGIIDPTLGTRYTF